MRLLPDRGKDLIMAPRTRSIPADPACSRLGRAMHAAAPPRAKVRRHSRRIRRKPGTTNAAATGGNPIAGRAALLSLLHDEGSDRLPGSPGATELPIMHALGDDPAGREVEDVETAPSARPLPGRHGAGPGPCLLRHPREGLPDRIGPLRTRPGTGIRKRTGLRRGRTRIMTARLPGRVRGRDGPGPGRSATARNGPGSCPRSGPARSRPPVSGEGGPRPRSPRSRGP